MKPDPDRWQRLRAAFDQLSELSPDEQSLQLDRMTFDDPAHRAEVESLLLAARSVGNRFEQSPNLPDDLDEDTGEGPAVEGRRIGPYRVTREIGAEGWGQSTKRTATTPSSPSG